jgi:uncharacterized protein YraI
MKLTCGRCQVMRLSLAAVALVLAGAWVPVQAFTASIVTHVHLRAGPSIEYPGVVMLAPGAVVEVYGCEQGYGWCDVQVGPDRGWIAASYLQMPSPGGPVIVASGGVGLGIPVVSFVFDTYWGNYYRGRPWYSRRAYYHNYWNRYPHGRPPPGPRPPPGGGKPAPGGGKPGGGGKPPPGGGKPSPGNGNPGNGNGRPPPGTRPSPGPGQ